MDQSKHIVYAFLVWILVRARVYLMVDVALHGHEEAIKLLIMPKGALTCQLGIQVILQGSAT